MRGDERAIRDVINEWHRATAVDDVDAVLCLMTDDVVFLVPGREPFGKSEFEAASRERSDVKIESASEIEEIHVVGDWGWARTRITVTMTPSDGESNRRTGSTLSIFRREPDGNWRLARDANLLA
jgi:uncharacterized protein (TIGR02246 family)